MIGIIFSFLIACPQPAEEACVSLPVTEFAEYVQDRADLNLCQDDRRTDQEDARVSLQTCERRGEAARTRADALDALLDTATRKAAPPLQPWYRGTWITFAGGAALGAVAVYAVTR